MEADILLPAAHFCDVNCTMAHLSDAQKVNHGDRIGVCWHGFESGDMFEEMPSLGTGHVRIATDQIHFKEFI
jgi:hypothetical protein